MSNEEFLSRGNDVKQKLQEALVASTFSLGFQKHISPVKIRMVKVHEKLLDFELTYQGNMLSKFELVMALPPSRKLRKDYQDGKRPQIPNTASFSDPVNPEWIASMICKKTEKARNIDGFTGHLLVYQNICGGKTDFKRLTELIADSESIWQSIWLIKGVPDQASMVLLCNLYGFPCVEREWLNINQ